MLQRGRSGEDGQHALRLEDLVACAWIRAREEVGDEEDGVRAVQGGG